MNCQGLWHVRLTDGQTDLGEILANIWPGSGGQKLGDGVSGCYSECEFHSPASEAEFISMTQK